MAKSKYTEEMSAIICEAISKTGRESAGIKAGGISRSTYYNWKDSIPEFRAAISYALEVFRSRLWESDPYLVNDAVNSLKSLLDGRKETWVKKHYKVSEKGEKILESITTTSVKRSPSPWAISVVLGIDLKGNRISPEINQDTVNTVDFEFEIVGENETESK